MSCNGGKRGPIAPFNQPLYIAIASGTGATKAGAGTMSHEFVETGQTFTSDGAAYCPIERKRRGPAALIASLTVLFAGTGFLSYAVLSEPASTPQTAPAEAPIVAQTTPPDIDAAPAAALESPLAAAPATNPAPPMSVAEALAESRAARAGVAANDELVEVELKPRLNPRRATAEPKDASDKVALAPQIKPTPDAAPVSPIARAQPAKMHTALRAPTNEAPPPFFFASDITPRDAPVAPAPVRFAGDIAQDFGALRVRITKGETFVDALKRAGVDAEDRNAAAYAFGKFYNLRRLRPGQEFDLTLSWPNQTLFQLASSTEQPQPQLVSLEFRADPESRVVVRRNAKGGFDSEKNVIPLTTRVLSVAGAIHGSLYLSAKAEGAPDKIIADLADAFAYDVDFQREIFGGDESEAIFEERYDDQGEPVSVGDIIYARLKWRGRSREKGYYRFVENDGRASYFDAAGQSAKRLLMKTPVDGARLSSGFGTRKHPILGYAKAHKGIDFAAPRGTPVKAAGDGVVMRANRYGSFGNYVLIRHANGYETAYAHLNGFARGMHKGKRVRQGDVIAYIGTTGRSTGPHLHYEVHYKGVAVNPQKLKIATGKKLTGAELARFKAQRDIINAMRLPPKEDAPLYAKGDASGAGGK